MDQGSAELDIGQRVRLCSRDPVTREMMHDLLDLPATISHVWQRDDVTVVAVAYDHGFIVSGISATEWERIGG